jgi:hypothetical protein
MGKQQSKRDRVRAIERERHADRAEFCDINRAGAGGKFMRGLPVRGTPAPAVRAVAPPQWTSEHDAQNIPAFVELKKSKDALQFMDDLRAWVAENFPQDRPEARERCLAEVDDLATTLKALPRESIAKLRPLCVGAREPIGALCALKTDLAQRDVFLVSRSICCRCHDRIKEIRRLLEEAGFEHRFYSRGDQHGKETNAA